jgi:hypothetical protein
MAMPKNTLIVQFPRTMNPEFSLERLHDIELSLEQGLIQNRSGIMDGHDWGADGANLFIFPSPGQSWPSMDVVKAYLKRKGLLDTCIIVKRFKSERYEVIWPVGYTGEFERT